MQHVPDPALPRAPLKQRMIHAGMWSVAGYGLSQIIRFGSNLVMARLLAPEFFGVMGIATVVMVGLTLFSDLGLRLNIIQSRRGHEPAFLNTAWAIQIVRGIVLWLIAVVCGLALLGAQGLAVFPASSVYAHPVLPWVIGVLGLSTILAGLESTKMAEASRNLVLGRVTLIAIVSQLAGLLCMLGLVAFERSVWVLVAGGLVAAVVTTVLSHAWMPGTPNRWAWDRSAVHEIVHFAKWIFLSSIVGFFAIHGDRVLIGGLVDATTLGVYTIAFLMFSAVEQVISRIVSGVTFPAISEIARERREELKKNYYRIVGIVAPFTYFCAGLLAVVGQPLVSVLFDQRYEAAGWMLGILAFGLITAPFMVAAQCFVALGRTDLTFAESVIRLLTLAVAVPVGFQFFGVSGAVAGVVASRLFCLPLIFMFGTRFGFLDWRRELIQTPAILLGVGAGELSIWALRHWLPQ